MSGSSWRSLQALLLAALLPTPFYAQSVTATVTGTIHDPSGALIQNATVTVTDLGTNTSQTFATNNEGEYTFVNLAPSSYRLEVDAVGFQHYTQRGITLNVSQNAMIDVGLLPGASSSVVTVEADANAIDTTDVTISSVVTGSEIRNLPLNSRNPYSLIALTPGFAGSVGNNYNSVGYSINGTRQGYTDVLVDGIPGGFPTVNGNSGVGVFPSVDAINQFRVLGQNYPAEFGRSLGGILNTAFKSGTNRFHGTLFEFARNSGLDANDYFSNRNKRPLLNFQRNQFGGVLNGPILHDKLFFLVSAELLRASQATQTTATVPTLLQRQGDFSQTFTSAGVPVQIYDPFSTRSNGAGGYIRTPFMGNIIPKTRQSRVGQTLMNYYPLPNIAGDPRTGQNNFFATSTQDNRIDSWDVRLDARLRHNQTLFGRYSDRFYDDNPQPFFPAAISKAENRIEQRNWMRNFVVGYTATPKPNLVYDVRIGFARALYDYLNAGLGFQASDLGLPSSVVNGGGLPIFPVVTANSYVQLGNGDNRHNAFMSYSLLQSVTWLKGNHVVKAGLDARMIRVNDRETRDTSGNYAFTSGFTQGPNPSAASTAAGNSIASLLLGTGTGDLIQNFKDAATQSFYYGAYVQDDWRITPKLTLSLGLRYDLDTPRTERFNRTNYFDPNVASPALAQASGISGLKGGLVFVGVGGQDRHQYSADTNNFAPRFGLAYSVDKNTVIHAGFAVVYGPSAQAAAGTIGPFGFRVQNDWVGSLDGITPFNTLDNPFPNGFQPVPGAAQGVATGAGGQIQGVLRNTPTPYAEQYTFNVDRELPGKLHVQVGYVGNHGVKLQQSREGGIDFNQLPVSALALGSSLNDLLPNPFFGAIKSGTLSAARVSRAQLLRPYPQFTSVQPLFMTGAQTKYNALQVQLEKRMSFGLELKGNYVYSKAWDSNTTHQDSYNPMYDYAVASQDVPHRVVLAYTYELPVGAGRSFGATMNRAVDALIGGWQINGITTLQSGTPLQVTASNTSGLGNPTLYANWNGSNPTLDGDIHNRLTRYFDTTAFTQPVAFSLGNAPAYISQLRSPRLVTTDFSLFKAFHLRETMQLQLRGEAFNVFNHVQFGSPNTSVNSTAFGTITSQANTPRQLQFGAKLLF
ncbi:TonB-dependent receptor [Terriglobus tenax]|uniref:TonB-dependent receptor n=1 Tax=Terriglobus tenax TaxID=1111115 RepID=UPI0021DFCCC8|nr:TonB-dependent receptor [Terriglobus tenax]